MVWSDHYGVDSVIKKLGSKRDLGIHMITQKGRPQKVFLILVYWRDFTKRLAEHSRDILRDLRRIRIQVGRIKLERGKMQSLERTEDVECLLIYVHQPEYNVRCKSSYNGRELKIINAGRSDPLKKQTCSEDHR